MVNDGDTTKAGWSGGEILWAILFRPGEVKGKVEGMAKSGIA